MEKKKVLKIVGWVVFGLFAAAVIVSFVFNKKIFGAETIFVPTEGQDGFVNYMMSRGFPAIIRTVQIVVIAVAASIILSLLYHLFLIIDITVHIDAAISPITVVSNAASNE